MKHLLVFFALIFSISVLFGQEVNKKDSQGRKQGPWIGKYENGKKKYVGSFLDDKPVGEFKYYDAFGTLTKIVDHRGDSSLATFYHTTGKVMGTGKYFKKEKVGIWKYYDEEGDISLEEPYVAGKLEGLCITYYKDGAVTRKQEFVNGEKHGKCTDYFKNGKMKFSGKFVDGNLDGYIVHYHPNGLEWQRGKYKAAVKDGKWLYFDEKGKLEAIETYNLGERIASEKPSE